MDHPTRIVFIGDSITDAGRDRTDPASLGDGYVSLLAAELAANGATVRNLGISGDRAKDLAARWDAELMPTAPDLLTVYVGVNDMWRRFDSDDATSAEDFASTLRALLTQAVGAHHPRLILMEPFFLPVHVEQEDWLPDLDEKRDAVRALAAEFGAELVPLHDIFRAAVSEHPIADLAPDGVHPTRLGSELIAGAWREAALAGQTR
ncbi:SGNH/GDSL hydrolase family protein [Microbacterium aurantiacum]|uniref:SGNH/GDSL hydrolase family protein n=1 Tax=Microbacterium aurantiacum TaxID=162393 RepID=UPI000C7F9DEA|nr:SGNH/GDSL hydrolase family protein [Microbacterium aurantiacum]